MHVKFPSVVLNITKDKNSPHIQNICGHISRKISHHHVTPTKLVHDWNLESDILV